MVGSNSKEILISITGRNVEELKNKILEIEKLGIKRVALFLTFLNFSQKQKIYELLLSSGIQNIPLVHVRHDMIKEELEFLEKNFNVEYFTIHEDAFGYFKKWNGFHKKMYLEFNYDNYVPENVDVKKVGGFCIDLSHFKASEERGKTKDFKYVNKRKNYHNYFMANHLNGYSYVRKKDLHTIRSFKDFDYLRTLPKYLFGRYIALEVFNSIEEQLKYRKYLIKFLDKYI